MREHAPDAGSRSSPAVRLFPGAARSGLASLGVVLFWGAFTGAVAAPRNLAARNNGGVIAWYTSKDNKVQMAHLVDGKVNNLGWRSKDDYLPQEIVFAFKNDEPAMVGRVVLNPLNPGRTNNWVRKFVVLLSQESPLDGFEEAGRFTLQPEPRDQEFVIGKVARFLKLRMIGNGGGTYTSLGEVRILEGDSVEDAPAEAEKDRLNEEVGARKGRVKKMKFRPDEIVDEVEPNDSPAEANLLAYGEVARGRINPAGETDSYRIVVPDDPAPVLTVELLGDPNIRTSVSLLGPDGAPLKRYDPGKVPAREVAFSWAVDPGQQVLSLTEPPVYLVMIWDTSGSMRNSAGKLQQAVESYLEQVTPSERVKLIRFSKSVEVITEEFLSDPEALRTAAAEKFKTQSGTAAYDAVRRGIELLEEAEGNRGIILMTDGKDSASGLDHAGFWKLLAEKRIRLYSIALGGSMRSYSAALGTTGERMMGHAALATDGRYFYADKAEELAGLYQEIANELRAKSVYHMRTTSTGLPGTLEVLATGEPMAAVTTPPQIELILDASASMRERLGGRYKINIAKRVMKQIIHGLPDDVEVALRFYGHRIPGNLEGDCEDSELVFPFGEVDKARLTELVDSVKAVGTTPLAFSLRQVAGDFQGNPGEKMVVVVTDGKEECGGDPVAAVEALLEEGLKLRLNVVGFALADEATKEEMRRITAMTRGRFYDTRNAEGLTKAIQDSLAVPYEVLDESGEPVAEGLTSRDPIQVPEGIYTVKVNTGKEPIHVPNVRITFGQTTRVTLKKEGQEMGVSVNESAVGH